MIPEQEHQTITYKNLVLDMDSYTAVVDGVSFDLTQREFEVVLGTSHEMTVYVRTQQILVSKKVIANIFANRLPLIFFINFISHPSDCLDKDWFAKSALFSAEVL